MADKDDTARLATDTHDFAPFVRILGRGPGRARSLSRAEARRALGMVLRGEATDAQIGAFLMLLRYRGEAVDEMAGLVEAARHHAGLPLARPVDLDWPSYADGRTRTLPWYLLAALLLAGDGVRVLMHGPATGPGRQSLMRALDLLGERPGFSFLPLERLDARLAALLALRGELGLRSPLNTVGRLLNPADAPVSVDGVFHPNYIALHAGVGALLGRRIAILKGGGGEAEWTGQKPLTVTLDGAETVWPLLEGAGPPASTTEAEMAAVWRGERADPGGETAVIATAAVALFALGRDDCVARARALWAARRI